MLTRRMLLHAGACLMTGAILASRSRVAAASAIEIRMRSDSTGGVVGFDPVGVFLQPGQTVRWTCDANVHTTTAYSPENGNRSLRIPRNARPWASDFLLPGETFEVTLTAEGVYDYFCAPHEEGGMVGRLIVGRSIGPGTLPFDYFEAEGRHWIPVPVVAQRVFPNTDEILRRKVVPSTLNFPG
jgi:plastocyanin